MTTPTETTHPNRGAAQNHVNVQGHDFGSSSNAVPDMSLPLEHRVYDCFESAGEIREAWDALAGEEGDFFGSFDWCALWWKHYGSRRRLEIHAFFEGSQLVGVAPLFREELAAGPFRVRALRIVGCDHSTTTVNLLLRRDRAEKVLAMLIEKVTRDDAWDLIHFGRLPGYFAHTDLLVRLLGSGRHVGHIERMQVPHPHTLIDLPGSFDEYLKGLSYRERHNIRKESRRLSSEHGLVGIDAATDGDAQTAIERFIEYHQAQWTEKGHRGHFDDWPGARAFHQDVARVMSQSGRLLIREVRGDGQLLSMAYAFRCGRRIHWFLAARSMDARWHFCFPGRVGACDLVKTAIEQGCSQVDMGIGYYPYKLKLGGRLYPVMNIAVVRSALPSAVKVWLLRKIALFHDVLGYRLWYTRIGSRFPSSRRSLNRRWIRLRLWPDDARDLGRLSLMALTWPGSLLARLRRLFGMAKPQSDPGAGAKPDASAIDSAEASRTGGHVVTSEPRNGMGAEFVVRPYRFSCELGVEERKTLRQHGGRFLESAVSRRLDRGEELWIAWLGAEPAGMCWSDPKARPALAFAEKPTQDSHVLDPVAFDGFEHSGLIALMNRTVASSSAEANALRTEIATR